jgi:arylsulfatase A-like enzyme
MVWLVDWIVGQVLEALDRTGQVENTLIFVTSDNGALPGDRILNENGEEIFRLYDHTSCGDWRGYKAHIWEGGHREPLIARWPGIIEPGTTTAELTCLTDLMVTCAAITGNDLPKNAAEDSYNILPVLKGEHLAKPIREALIHHSGLGIFSVRQGPWKVILETQGSGGWPPPCGSLPDPGMPGQLYNIKEDPAEEQNLWNDHPEVIRQLTALLDRYKKEGRSAPRNR